MDGKEKREYYKNEIKKLKEELKNGIIQYLSIRTDGNSYNNSRMNLVLKMN